MQGIIFSVRPPKKSWKNITQLSGGEKTLSSLALVFALHHFKPTPLYFMDEIDAALDFKNVSIVAHYVKEQTKCVISCSLIAMRHDRCRSDIVLTAGMHSLSSLAFATTCSSWLTTWLESTRPTTVRKM